MFDFQKSFLTAVEKTFSLTEYGEESSIRDNLKDILRGSVDQQSGDKISFVYQELQVLEEFGVISIDDEAFNEQEGNINMYCQMYASEERLNIETLDGVVEEQLGMMADELYTSQTHGYSPEESLERSADNPYGETREFLGDNVTKGIADGTLEIRLQGKQNVSVRYDTSTNEFIIWGGAPSVMIALHNKISAAVPRTTKEQEEGGNVYTSLTKNDRNMRPLMGVLLDQKFIGFEDYGIFMDAVNEHSQNLGKG